MEGIDVVPRHKVLAPDLTVQLMKVLRFLTIGAFLWGCTGNPPTQTHTSALNEIRDREKIEYKASCMHAYAFERDLPVGTAMQICNDLTRQRYARRK